MQTSNFPKTPASMIIAEMCSCGTHANIIFQGQGAVVYKKAYSKVQAKALITQIRNEFGLPRSATDNAWQMISRCTLPNRQVASFSLGFGGMASISYDDDEIGRKTIDSIGSKNQARVKLSQIADTLSGADVLALNPKIETSRLPERAPLTFVRCGSGLHLIADMPGKGLSDSPHIVYTIQMERYLQHTIVSGVATFTEAFALATRIGYEFELMAGEPTADSGGLGALLSLLESSGMMEIPVPASRR